MDAPVVAALVGAGASIAISLASSVTSARSSVRLAQLEHELRNREAAAAEEAEATKVLDRYREPLCEAAYFLQNRLWNIQQRGFVRTYAVTGHERRADAILSTLYRVADFLGWREILRHDIQFLDFREPRETREVAELLSSISKRFATDEGGQGFMLWYEEQRAIGALMVDRQAGQPGCISYASFVEQYERSFRRWFEGFERISARRVWRTTHACTSLPSFSANSWTSSTPTNSATGTRGSSRPVHEADDSAAAVTSAKELSSG